MDPSDVLAAASRKQGIPTGGAAGFVLAKSSTTDYDDGWADPRTLGRRLFQGRGTAAQTLAANTWTSLALAGEDVDDLNGHSTTVNPSRWTCPTGADDWYEVSAIVLFAGSASGTRQARLTRSGTQVPNSQVLSGALTASIASLVIPSMLVQLTAGQYVELQALSTIAISTFGSTTDGALLSVRRA
jgi:hypothetical protein